jgi:hypothetical protein
MLSSATRGSIVAVFPRPGFFTLVSQSSLDLAKLQDISRMFERFDDGIAILVGQSF